MKRLLITWVLIGIGLFSATPSWAGAEFQEFVLQDAAVAIADGASMPVKKYVTVAVDVTIATTATVTFEGSVSGVAWTSVACSTINTGVTTSATTTTGLYQCNVAGLSTFRARISSWGAGAVTVYARATTAQSGNVSGIVSERAVASAAAVMVNGDTVYTISEGPILIVDLYSICITANGAVASTMQWQSAPTVGSAATFSGASGSLINATAGTTVRLQPTILTTAPTIVTAANGGLQVPIAATGGIIVNAGAIKLVIGTGSTTGTWKHYIRYKPLSPSATVN